MPLVDLIVLLVLYVDLILTSNRVSGLQVVRVIRVMRLLALLKVERHTNSFQTVIAVLDKKKHELFGALFLTMVLLVASSITMFYIEHKVQPFKFASIASAMWWAVTAMTSVGYGDVYPITALGKVFGSCTAILGLSLFALPSGMIASGFMEVMQQRATVEAQADAEDIAQMINNETEEVRVLRKETESLFMKAERARENQAIASAAAIQKNSEDLQQLRHEVDTLHGFLERIYRGIQCEQEQLLESRVNQQNILSLLKALREVDCLT